MVLAELTFLATLGLATAAQRLKLTPTGRGALAILAMVLGILSILVAPYATGTLGYEEALSVAAGAIALAAIAFSCIFYTDDEKKQIVLAVATVLSMIYFFTACGRVGAYWQSWGINDIFTFTKAWRCGTGSNKPGRATYLLPGSPGTRKTTWLKIWLLYWNG